MIVELILLVAVVLLPVPVALVLARRGWPRWRVLIVAPLPLPVLFAVPAVVFLASGLSRARAECGESCGTTMLLATVALILALVGYLAGVAATAILLVLRGRRDSRQTEHTFR